MAVAFWAALGAQTPPSPDDSLPDVVVIARRGSSPQILHTPVEYLERLCYQPARLTGHFAPPGDDPDWAPLEPNLRARFGAADPTVPAFRLDDPQRDAVLLVRFETKLTAGGLSEQRCIFAIIGKVDGAPLEAGLSRLFRSGGTQRHVGDRNGVPLVRGWRQKLWTAMPSRRSKNWPSFSPRDSWIVVTDRSYYDAHDYIAADLKVRADQRVAMLSFSFTSAQRRNAKSPADRQSSR